jgi:predicted Zn-dependent protease
MFDADLDSFRSFITPSQPWEAYVQGRKAIHVEYGNISSAEQRLKLTPVSRWGARITTPARRERFTVEGHLDARERSVRASSVTATLPGDFPLPEEAHTMREVIEPKLDPDSMPAERLWREILASLRWIIERLSGERFQVKVWSGWEFRGYYNSLGSRMTSHFPLSKLKISVRLRESGLIKRAGARNGIEFFRNLTPGWAEDFLEDVKHGKDVAKEKFIPKVLILDPEATAMFIHEAIGHAMEGDHVLAGDSYLSDSSGRQIASPDVTVVDSPKDYPGLGSYPFDDEGVLAQTTPLVKNGIVRGHLTDRWVGHRLETKSTGNCRSFWYDATPKVRMSNLVMLPGERSFEAILRETEDGLLVKGMKEGGCDERTGDFHLKPNVAYRITNGELKGVIATSEVAGNAKSYLKAITDVSREWSMTVAGCGKPTPQSDYAWVGYGAPFVKFELHKSRRG